METTNKLKQSVSISEYFCEYDYSINFSVEKAVYDHLCEYKWVYDDPPDSSEKTIQDLLYIKKSDYEEGINRLIDSGNCEIPAYANMELTESRGKISIEQKDKQIYVSNRPTYLSIDDLLGKKCSIRETYYGKIR